MEAKFKIGDRVVVSMDCDDDLSGRDPVQFRGKSGRIAGVWTYQDGVATDYDVIIDEHEAQNARGCPGFEEKWLTMEAV